MTKISVCVMIHSEKCFKICNIQYSAELVSWCSNKCQDNRWSFQSSGGSRLGCEPLVARTRLAWSAIIETPGPGALAQFHQSSSRAQDLSYCSCLVLPSYFWWTSFHFGRRCFHQSDIPVTIINMIWHKDFLFCLISGERCDAWWDVYNAASFTRRQCHYIINCGWPLRFLKNV